MNKEQVYDAEIDPLMEQIIERCKANGIAMLASFAIHGPGGPGSEDSLYCTTYLPAANEEFDPALRRAINAIGVIRPFNETPMIRTVEPGGKTTITEVVP